MLRAADGLCEQALISGATWQALAERYNTQQLMDLIFNVGQYNLVPMALNTLGGQSEAGIHGFEYCASR